MSNSNAVSSAQALLDALIELRRLGPAGVFSDSGRFRAVMLDLCPGMKKEVRVLSALIDAGYLQRLQDAAESEREIVSAQIRFWLDEELDLKSETAHNYSSVLLAFFSGAVSVAAAGSPSAQSSAGVPSGTPQPSVSAAPSVPPKPSNPSLCDVYANKLVGDCFEFGRWPQGAYGEVMPITWRVLERAADHLLVIAEQSLDRQPYHADHDFGKTVWANCTLRDWLNSVFLDEAFNKKERKCIMSTTVVNNAGPDTTDYIFLLSGDEAESLFANNSSRRTEPTEYAVRRGVSGGWWLRSLSRRLSSEFIITETDVAVVDDNGGVDDVNSDRYNRSRHRVDAPFAVRPAFRIAL